MIRLFDAHAHIQDDRFKASLNEVHERWRKANITNIASCGSCQADWVRLAELAGQMSEIIPSFGLHPWYLKEADSSWRADLIELLEKHPDAGVGEVGLDYAVSTREDQLMHDMFTAQLEIAVKMNRAVSIHCRRAWDVLPELLKSMNRPPRGFMVHSFSGGIGQVDTIVKLGGFISFSGSITRHRNKRGIDACRKVPLDHLLIETDSPDILPSGVEKNNAGRLPNEPENLLFVLNRVAEIRGMPAGELAEATYNNAVRLFHGRDNQ
jgi:TatD DNase family protein